MSLTPDGMPPTREAWDVGDAIGRLLLALVRRTREGDLAALESLAVIERAIEREMPAAMRAAHDADYSWTEIARALGVTRQAAWERANR